MSNLATFTPEIEALLEKNANPANWAPWDVPPHWTIESSGKWKSFTEKWAQHDPTIPLYDNHRRLDLSPLSLVAPFQRSILVRECYDKAVNAVLHKSSCSPTHDGVILTGQPGIGKSTFLLYLLAVLLNRKQPVFLDLVPDQPPLLFYRGCVYEHFSRLFRQDAFPKPLNGAHIWSLFEASSFRLCYLKESFFPVQTPSPNYDVYKSFSKIRTPLLTVFPLWTREELKAGLQLHNGFPAFRDHITKLLDLTTLPAVDSPYNYAYPLSVLLKSAEQDQRPNSFEGTLELLIDSAIDTFGYVARDIFAVLILGGYEFLVQKHDFACRLSCHDLRTTVEDILAGNFPDSFQPSHQLVCISSHSEVGRTRQLSIQFKSKAVVKRLAQYWAHTQKDQIPDLIDYLSHIPAAHSLVEGLHEFYPHGLIQSNNQVANWDLQSNR